MPTHGPSAITGVKMLDRQHFYRNWPRLIERSLEYARSSFAETHFKCSACAMAKPMAGVRTRDLGPFSSRLKCCTFSPFLPSFTIGELLNRADQDLAQRLDRYFESVILCPLGGLPKRAPTGVCETGKHDRDRCEFLDDSDNPKCTIFEFRPSPCASYVCSSLGHERSAEQYFTHWRHYGESLKEFEWTLAHLTAFEAGYTQDDVRVQFQNRDEAISFFRRARVLAQSIQSW